MVIRLINGSQKSAQAVTEYVTIVNMKRILLILSLLLPVAAFAGTPQKTISKAGISAVISECRHYEGAEVVSLGRFATAAMKGVIRIAAKDDPDAREAISVMKGVHGISVLDFEDCSEKDKARIIKQLDKILSGSDMLMEASDNGEKMRIYGVMDEKTNEVKDFVLYAPSDCSLICLFGTLSMDAMAKIASND